MKDKRELHDFFRFFTLLFLLLACGCFWLAVVGYEGRDAPWGLIGTAIFAGGSAVCGGAWLELRDQLKGVKS